MRPFAAILLWLLSVAAVSDTLYPTNPNLADSAVFVSGSGLTRLDYENLSPRWHSLEGVHPFEPVVAGGTVLVGSPVGVFALNIEDGAVRWHLSTHSAQFSPTIAGALAYTGGEDGLLRAVDLDTGDVKWERPLSGWIFSPAVVGELMVTGGKSGEIWGVDLKGKTRWQVDTGEELIGPPVAAEAGPVYITTNRGKLLALAPEDGAVRWETRLATPGVAVVDGERLFAGQFSGLITAHNRYTGEKLWEHQLESPTTIPLRILNGQLVAITKNGGSVMLDPEDGTVLEQLHDPEVPSPPFGDQPEFLAAAP